MPCCPSVIARFERTIKVAPSPAIETAPPREYMDIGNFSCVCADIYVFGGEGTNLTLNWDHAICQDGVWLPVLAAGEALTFARASQVNFSQDLASNPLYRWLRWNVANSSGSAEEVTIRIVYFLKR
jgi:hypothetical protein